MAYQQNSEVMKLTGKEGQSINICEAPGKEGWSVKLCGKESTKSLDNLAIKVKMQKFSKE